MNAKFELFLMLPYGRNKKVQSLTRLTLFSLFVFCRSCDEYTDTFQDVVYLAEKEDRLIKGIFNAAHVLEM